MGGGGLIGFTPLPAGYVTGNPVADLQTQLTAILSYNQQWAQYIPALNAATNPTDAADIYMNYFERPGIPAAANREAAANAVAQACRL
jgi:predicted Zn-dependent protease